MISKANKSVEAQVLAAYADCGWMRGERQLDFAADEWVTRDEAVRILSIAVPRGYNEFCADLLYVFSEDALIRIGRASSPCIWVLDDPMPSRDILRADEVSEESDGSWRFWWD